jgi:hypothetical protein
MSIAASTADRRESLGVVFMFGDTGVVVGLRLRTAAERFPRSMGYVVEVCSGVMAFM